MEQRRHRSLSLILIVSVLITVLALCACGSSHTASSVSSQAPSEDESGSSALSATAAGSDQALITSISYQEGEDVDLVTASYDNAGNPTQVIITERDGAQTEEVTTESYHYDEQGNLSKLDLNINGSPITGTGAQSSEEQTAEGLVITNTFSFETANQGDTVSIASLVSKVRFASDGVLTQVEESNIYEGSDGQASLVRTWTFDGNGLPTSYTEVKHEADGTTETESSYIGTLETKDGEQYLVLSDQENREVDRFHLNYENGLLTSLSEGGDGMQVTIEYEAAPEASSLNIARNKVAPMLFLLH